MRNNATPLLLAFLASTILLGCSFGEGIVEPEESPVLHGGSPEAFVVSIEFPNGYDQMILGARLDVEFDPSMYEIVPCDASASADRCDAKEVLSSGAASFEMNISPGVVHLDVTGNFAYAPNTLAYFVFLVNMIPLTMSIEPEVGDFTLLNVVVYDETGLEIPDPGILVRVTR